MALDIKDVKPGDLLCYNENWYIMVVQDHEGRNKNLKYLWISGNSRPEFYDSEGFRLGHKNTGQGLESMLLQCTKVSSINVKNLIEELEKIKNHADGT